MTTFDKSACARSRGKKFTGRHLTLHADQFDVLPNAKGFGENNRQTGDDIAEHALHRQTDANSGHANASDGRSGGNSKFLQHRQGREGDYEQAATRTRRSRTGGSICVRSSQRSKTLPIHRATSIPTARMMSAPATSLP
jgi:hypothetical protein